MANRRIIRGDTDTFIVKITRVATDSNGLVINTPVDITGWKIRFTVRATIPATTDLSDSDAIISKLGVNSTTDTGVCTFTISKEETNIDVGEYYYDIQCLKPDGTVQSIPRAKYIVVADITRDEDWT